MVPKNLRDELPEYTRFAGQDDSDDPAGPFDVTPDLAQATIVHTVGLYMIDGKPSTVKISWDKIRMAASPEMREKLSKLSAVQTLPASIKVMSAVFQVREGRGYAPLALSFNIREACASGC